MKRRRFLQGAAAITVVAAGGTVWRAGDQGVFRAAQGSAYEPWHDWHKPGERSPLELVRAGILAANPHNTQPWVFHVEGNTVELYADCDRNLGSFDPYLREMHLGLGCALENILLAARANGYEPRLELAAGQLRPIEEQPQRQRVARITLTDNPAQDSPLHAAIPHRHTNRGPYEAQRALPDEVT
ncbi:twin-arginine translocation signal domain-containing protein [Aquisalimonas sp. APHAB1-3]|uniref:Twin-arginine translocation signal domain-containing protein n=1 Tax=Spiribacter salinus TaxID=1335746 RepID=A0A540VQ70_9GAMM|nr:MAG: twin-arginine translocation signal domain-containing protein [Spiribacter salinus]